MGFEGYYSVSSEGRVRRDKPAPHTRRGLILKSRVNRGGYPQVGLRRDGQKKHYAPLHRWVAVAFLGDPGPEFEINHMDGDKLNARAVNLEWVTKSANMVHAITSGLYRTPEYRAAGAANPAAKLTPELVAAIRADIGTLVQLGAKYGVAFSTISRIRRGETWKEVMP